MHVTQRNVNGGTHWSASRAYIDQPGPRPNLAILMDSQVTRIEFSNKRAVRVHLQGKGSPLTVEVGASSSSPPVRSTHGSSFSSRESVTAMI
jgi:choline dehydrogenase